MSSDDKARCASCLYWDREGSGDVGRLTTGWCRYRPPTMDFGFPQTRSANWCGSWRSVAENDALEVKFR